MVGVAQLVERRVVVADVAGSSPVTHPTETAGREATPGLLFLQMPADHRDVPQRGRANLRAERGAPGPAGGGDAREPRERVVPHAVPQTEDAPRGHNPQSAWRGTSRHVPHRPYRGPGYVPPAQGSAGGIHRPYACHGPGARSARGPASRASSGVLASTGEGGEGPRRRGGGSSGSPRHPTPRHWGVAWQSGRGRGRPSRPHGDARTAHPATATSLRAVQAGTSETRAARLPPPTRPGLTSTTECHLPGA